MRNESQDLDQFDGLTQVLNTSPVPVFTHREEFMGHGVIGGDMRQLALDASRMAEMALLIASGMSPRDIPVANNTYDVMVDWRQLQRWQIPESRVPANSEVLFRAPSFFEQYWRYLAAIGGLLMAQGAIIATLYIQRARRRESEARNMAILRAAPDIMFLQNRDGVYLDYHAPSQKCLFVPPEHFIGYNMREVLPPEVLAHVLPLFEQARDSDHMVVGEYALDIKGSRMYLEARLVRCGDDKVLSVVRDITERTRTQAALIESEERYALATAAGGAGVWDWNLENGHIYVDPRLNRLLGHEDDEMPMTCEEWRRRVHPDDLPMVSARTERHLAGDTPTYEAEHRLLHKDGSIRWVAVRGSVVREDERLVRLVGTYSDITDRKEADERLRQVQADLNRVSRLAASGEFAASIAHEVSQPLTAIIINARTCLRWLASPSPDLNEVRTTLSEVIDAGKRADGIIRRNRELFRHHSVKKLPLDLNDVVGEVALLAGAHLSAHRVRLETRLADELPAVLGDRIELCQLLLNLIANGIDAMQGVVKSRVVTVTSELTPERDVLVSVSDAGSGLTGVDMSRMFTTGYTTKPKGTGVGLSICRSIVEAHGGRMWATQNDGPGATFWFIVPSAADEEARPPRETQETAMLQ
jgi:PAS domain S-box-containing protein